MQHEKRLFLNARRMTTRESAHAHIKARLRLPEWYGNNLDALHDCLGEIGEPTRITVRFAPLLAQQLGEYGTKLIRVLEESGAENAHLHIVLRTGFYR
jgi:ribonuclease inhibitor